MEKPTAAMIRLADQRAKAEARLETLRQALDREIGFSPRQIWWVPVVAFAFGLAAARTVGGRRKKKVGEREG